MKEAAKLLGVTPKTLRTLEKDGKIKSTRTAGGHRRSGNGQPVFGGRVSAGVQPAVQRTGSQWAGRASGGAAKSDGSAELGRGSGGAAGLDGGL